MKRKNCKSFFPAVTDPAVALVNGLNPYHRGGKLSSKDALALIDSIEAEQLDKPFEIVTKMAFTSCELEDTVKRTIGIQCLIYLFDPGNGWQRDCFKRGDMLLMTAKLIEKGVSLEGLYYYRGNPLIHDQAFTQTVQTLINNRDDDPPAALNDEILKIFKENGYNFSYPSENFTSSFVI